MTGVALLLVLGAAAWFAAASLRLESVVSTLLGAYIFLVGAMAGSTIGLSPFRAVHQRPLGAVAVLLLIGSVAVWLRRGRPSPPLAPAAAALRTVLRSPIAVGFLGVLVLALGYELLLALTVPPNNWDSLQYHLPRVAAWAQHGGIYWIANPPTDILNTRQPVAEQEILFLFVAFGKARLFALPQYLAELAGLLAVYGASRRLGFDARVALCTSGLLATFSLVALESMTAQNDLVAASFPAVAACLILGGTRTELLLAGAAAGIGLGVKLTTVFVWPVLAALAWMRSRRAASTLGVGTLAGLGLVGIWGYGLNVVETGRLLGEKRFQLDVSASPSFPGSLETMLHVLYRSFDISTLSDRLIARLAIVGLVAALLLLVLGSRRWGRRKALARAAAVAIALAAPVIVLSGAAVLAYVTKLAHVPVRVPGESGFDRRANEDYSAFGPVGTLMLLGTPVLAAVLYARRRLDARFLALALALPLFVVLLGLQVAYNPFVTRFLLVPALLTAPLFGLVLRRRTAAAALLVVAAIAIVLTLENDRTKPYRSAAAHPWHMNEAQALQYVSDPNVASADAAYESLVPAGACVGAVLSSSEPSYLLWGRNRARRVFYLTSAAVLPEALTRGVSYVVVDTAGNASAVDPLRRAGWSITPLGSYWLLATAPHPTPVGCS